MATPPTEIETNLLREKAFRRQITRARRRKRCPFRSRSDRSSQLAARRVLHSNAARLLPLRLKGKMGWRGKANLHAPSP